MVSERFSSSFFSFLNFFSFFQFFVLLVAPKFLCVCVCVCVNTATGHNFRSIWMKFAHNQHFIIPQIYFFHFFEKTLLRVFMPFFLSKIRVFLHRGHNFRSIWMKFAHNQHFIIPQIYFFHFFEKPLLRVFMPFFANYRRTVELAIFLHINNIVDRKKIHIFDYMQN